QSQRNQTPALSLSTLVRIIPRRLCQTPFSFGTASAAADALRFGSRGLQSRTAFAILRICSGVVPQQPPTMFSQPFATHAASLGANDSAVSGNPVGESGSGNPASGYAPT